MPVAQTQTLFILDATITGASYLWQDNSTDSVYTVFTQNIYWVDVTSADGCIQSSRPGAVYQWRDNSSTSSYTVTDPGFYWVEVTNADDCSNSDSVTIDFSTPPIVSLGNDTLLCEPHSSNLTADVSGVTYEWQDNPTDSLYTVSSSGLYWVKVTNT